MAARMTEDGLVTRRGRLIGWDELLGVHFTLKGAEVLTTSGSVAVDRDTGLAVEQRIAPWEAERAAWAEAQTEQTRAGWLGLRPDARITAVPDRSSMVANIGCFTAPAVLLAVVLAGLGWNLGLALLLLAWALGMLRMLSSLRTNQRPWTVDITGLTIGSRHLSWSELRDWSDLAAPANQKAATSISLASLWGDRWLTATAGEQHVLRQALRRWHAESRQAVPQPEGSGQQFSSVSGWTRWVVTGEGLWQVTRWRAHLTPWSEIVAVRQQGPLPELLLTSGRRRPLWMVVGGKRLAELIDQRLAGGEPLVDEQGQLRAAAIERWLGVEPGGSLQCRLSVWRGSVLGIVAIVLLAMMLAGYTPGIGILAGQLPALVLALWAVATSVSSVQADAQGLSVRRRGRREYYAWSEIVSTDTRGHSHLIHTARGMIRLAASARGAGLVMGVIERILDARAAGAALPDRAPLPDTALTRLTGTEPASDDRALSISERPEDD